jgi:malate dehydrogenase (oxaloacetate-decarboxylating)
LLSTDRLLRGIGLGAVLCRAKLVSDKMLVSAIKALAAQSPALKEPNKGLLPDIVDVRKVSKKVAVEIIRTAVDEGLATVQGIPVGSDDELDKWVGDQMWEPVYRQLRKVQAEGASRAAKGEWGVGRR